jgi:cytochrome c551/c552
MIHFDAWHSPLLRDEEILRMDERTVGDVVVRTPVLRPGALTRLASRLRAARDEFLLPTTTAELVGIIDSTAARMTEGEHRSDILAALPHTSGMSPAMAEHVLDMMARDWRAGRLDALLRSELSDVDMLDRFVAHGLRMTRAVGAPLVTHIFSGNVPGVSVSSLIRALLVRSASIGKSAAGEPLLAATFARVLQEVNPDVASSIAVLYWEGGRSESEDEALAAADGVVVYGSGDTIASIRARTPAGTSIIEHGPKLSIGIVSRGALCSVADAESIAISIARATAVFDQHGCVSPHVVFVERGAAVSPRDVAAAIAGAFGEIDRILPRRPLGPADAARIREAATRAEFRSIAGEDVELYEAKNALVIYDATPAIEASCLDRTLYVKPVDALRDVCGMIAPYRDVVQSAAVAGLDASTLEAYAATLARAGITRVTDFERLPWPDASWHHDGRGPLLELLRFIDLDLPRHH